MSRRSRTAQHEVGQTAPTLRGCEIMDRKKSARRCRSSLKSVCPLLARTTPFFFSAPEGTYLSLSRLYTSGELYPECHSGSSRGPGAVCVDGSLLRTRSVVPESSTCPDYPGVLGGPEGRHENGASPVGEPLGRVTKPLDLREIAARLPGRFCFSSRCSNAGPIWPARGGCRPRF